MWAGMEYLQGDDSIYNRVGLVSAAVDRAMNGHFVI